MVELTLLEPIQDRGEYTKENDSVHIHKGYSETIYNINILLHVLMSGSQGLGQAVKLMNNFAAPESVLKREGFIQRNKLGNEAGISAGNGRRFKDQWSSTGDDALPKLRNLEEKLQAEVVTEKKSFDKLENQFNGNGTRKGYDRVERLVQELFVLNLLKKRPLENKDKSTLRMVAVSYEAGRVGAQFSTEGIFKIKTENRSYTAEQTKFKSDENLCSGIGSVGSYAAAFGARKVNEVFFYLRKSLEGARHQCKECRAGNRNWRSRKCC
jgi:hypothetical protein